MRFVITIVVALMAAGITACGGSDDKGNSTGAAAANSQQDKLAQIQARGTLVGLFKR